MHLFAFYVTKNKHKAGQFKFFLKILDGALFMIAKNVVLVMIKHFSVWLTLHCVPPIHKTIHILKDMMTYC